MTGSDPDSAREDVYVAVITGSASGSSRIMDPVAHNLIYAGLCSST